MQGEMPAQGWACWAWKCINMLFWYSLTYAGRTLPIFRSSALGVSCDLKAWKIETVHRTAFRLSFGHEVGIIGMANDLLALGPFFMVQDQ